MCHLFPEDDNSKCCNPELRSLETPRELAFRLEEAVSLLRSVVSLKLSGSNVLLLRAYRWLLCFHVQALRNESAGFWSTQTGRNLFFSDCDAFSQSLWV